MKILAGLAVIGKRANFFEWLWTLKLQNIILRIVEINYENILKMELCNFILLNCCSYTYCEFYCIFAFFNYINKK